MCLAWIVEVASMVYMYYKFKMLYRLYMHSCCLQVYYTTTKYLFLSYQCRRKHTVAYPCQASTLPLSLISSP